MRRLFTILMILGIILITTGCISFDKKPEQPVRVETPVVTRSVQDLIMDGQLEEAKKRFQTFVEPNEKDTNGNTVLHAAAAYGDTDLIIYFMSKNVSCKIKNNDGDLPLHIAIRNDRYAAAKQLAEIDDSIYLINNEGKNALDLVAEKNTDEWYKALFSDAVGEKLNDKRQNLVHYYVKKQNEDAIKQCIKNFVPLSMEDVDGNTPLMLAYENVSDVKSINIAADLIMARCEPVRGDFSYFEDAIRTRNVSLRFDDNQTPLHIAVINNQSGIVEYLLENGASPSVQDITGNTPLHEAVKNGYLDIVKILLDNGANVNAKNISGQTPLLLEIGNGEKNTKVQIDIYDALLRKHADANGKNNYGDTVLHIATMGETDVSILQKLVDAGADINERNKSGATPLAIAIENNLKSHIDFYAKRGADINAEDNTHETPLTKVFSKGIDALKLLISEKNITSRDSAGNTPLHLAIKYRANIEDIRYLLDCGADIDARNSDGESLLYIAVVNNQKEAGEILISRGANVYATNNDNYSPLRRALENADDSRDWLLCSTIIEGDDGNGNTPLHYAAGWNLNDSISYIIDKGGQVNRKNANGETPLYNAVRTNNPSTVKLLISRGADTNTHDLLGNTPIHYAVQCRVTNSASALLSEGCMIDSKNTSGQTPLSKAARLGDEKMVNLLVSKKADINASDITGKTILTDAVQSSNSRMVELMLKYGASVNIQDMYGRNAYHEAVEVKNPEIINLLREAGGNPLSRDSFGKTPFSLSLTKTPDVIQAVIGTNLSLTDSDGNNPLHAAVSAHALPEIMQMLIGKGYPINQRNGNGLTPLGLAIKQNQQSLAIALLENSADPFITDNNGECAAELALKPEYSTILEAMAKYMGKATDLQGDTLLHYAARSADAKTIKFLLEKGLDIKAKNTAGETPFDIAKRWKRGDIVNLLL